MISLFIEAIYFPIVCKESQCARIICVKPVSYYSSRANYSNTEG